MPDPIAFSTTADLTSLAEAALDAAKAAGADAADTVVAAGTSTTVTLRNGVTEEVERSEGSEIGLRVFVGARSALVGVANVRDLADAAARAVAMARAAPEDDTVAPRAARRPRGAALPATSTSTTAWSRTSTR